MKLKGINVGFAMTGSHCTLEKVMPQLQKIQEEGGTVTAIISTAVDKVDSRFGEASWWKKRLKEITGREIIRTVQEAEPVGPEKIFDVIVIAPCTGNTLAKLANGITDTPVLMAAKAQLRNQRPVVLGVSTNDGLGINARNLGTLINAKNIYFIPFYQDNPVEKPNSITANFELLIPTILKALAGKQYQPILLG